MGGGSIVERRLRVDETGMKRSERKRKGRGSGDRGGETGWKDKAAETGEFD